VTIGELVSAAVVDERVWDSYRETAPDGVYLVGRPGPAMPFMLFRAWKVPTGFLSEEVRLVGPSGRTLYRWGPEVRRMKGMMDLTVELDRVDDAVLDETGTYVASFILDGVIVGELEFPVFVQAASQKLPKETEDGLRKSDVIWVGTRVNGQRRLAPVWFAYKDGKILLLSSRERSIEEQSVPGVPEAHELLVVTRRKGRDTSLQEFTAAQRRLEGPEWDAAAKTLVDRRRSRVGPPADSISRWRGSCEIVELTPNVGTLTSASA
jgi:hypothetical protein